MARKKKQPDLETLHEETAKALNKLSESVKEETSNEVIASKDIVMSIVKHKEDKIELVLKDHKNYSDVLLNLLLKGVYLALLIDSLPETLKEEYADRMHEAINNVLSCMSTKLPKDVLNDIDKKMSNLV